ncbi:MAG: hypothetical protein JRI71_14230, partial [Deltaproteobacteria bacterium]|nr:hypothetical protein [Deltaproteobacteria bacterium]
MMEDLTPEQIQKAREMLEQGVPPEIVKERIASSQITEEEVPFTERKEEEPAIPEKPEEKPRIPKREKPPEEKSEIEISLSGRIPNTISKELTQFGYKLFRTTVSTFAPVTDVPVGPDYVIGPGDRFSISTWGRLER